MHALLVSCRVWGPVWLVKCLNDGFEVWDVWVELEGNHV
jgi:hypothetical protein